MTENRQAGIEQMWTAKLMSIVLLVHIMMYTADDMRTPVHLGSLRFDFRGETVQY